MKKPFSEERFKGIEPKNTKQQVARILATVCGFMALVYLLGAPIRVDQWFLLLLVLAFLPWLGYFVRKGGTDSVELVDPEPKSTNKNALSETKQPSVPIKDFAALSFDAKIVLKTLDYYQRSQFGLKANSRWVFTVPFGQPGYVKFISGILELHSSGLVSFDLNSGMFGLSGEGISFLEVNENAVASFKDRFSFGT